MKDTFEKLSAMLAEIKIPAKLTEEKDMLTLLLPEEIAGPDVYGYVFFVPFSGDGDEGGYYMIRFELLDTLKLSGDDQQRLASAVSMINPVLYAGGYALTGYTPQTATDPETKSLIYQISVPVAFKPKNEWLLEELMLSIKVSAAVLKKSAPLLLDVAAQKTSVKDLLEGLYIQGE